MAVASDLSADTIAGRLHAEDTRVHTLDALDAISPSIPQELALAAAPALVDIAASTLNKQDLDRCTLLLARLLDEDASDHSVIFGAAFCEGRLAAYVAPRLWLEATQGALAPGGGQQLTLEDAYSDACLYAFDGPAWVRGITVPAATIGHSVTELFGIVRPCPRSFACFRGVFVLFHLKLFAVLAQSSRVSCCVVVWAVDIRRQPCELQCPAIR